MSPRLRPLQLPLLVEQRKRMEEAQSEMDSEAVYAFYNNRESSSSDSTSPVTPTFSPPGHLRYSSSTSSIELSTPSSSEPPSSPAQASHKSGKRVLPDVQEEPIESHHSEDEYEPLDDEDFSHLYDCLCVEPCSHSNSYLVKSTTDFYTQSRDVDYDIGFLSDNDYDMTLRSLRKRQTRAESTFSGLTHRIGSRFTGIARLAAKRPASNTNSPVSDYGFDQRPALSRATSSRSSSLSASGRYYPDRTNEPPLPPTPALSFYESSDSIALPAPIDIEQANKMNPSIERERALATTPLLPPMLDDISIGLTTALPSPLESPTVAMPAASEPQSPHVMSPPLSTKPSISSFHRMAMSGELPQDPDWEIWADRLGHANFTILPQPYKPDMIALSTLHQLRTDWDTARVNYTKHLVRTGEHYGTTSKTYAMTEAKWAETDGLWRRHHDQLVEAVVDSGAAATPKFDENILTTVPRMDTEGKFPERGDEDIVGPMVREATMMTFGDGADKKNSSFWRNLAGRVGLRR